MIEGILIFVFLLLLIYYLIFLYKIFSGLSKLKLEPQKEVFKEFISVIVPFRNEEKNISNTYISLTNQSYPADKYEIIFVNDFSDDNSLRILKNISKKENVFIYSVPIDYSTAAHKKRAIRFGIEKSRGEIIVTTDADCSHQNDWLKSLINYMDDKTGFVSGPVQFNYSSNIFKKMQQLEFAGLVITGAGLIGSGNPIICNAANIAYRRKTFDQVGGFAYQMSLSSGDDELLMQKIHHDTNYEIRFAADNHAIVSTEANNSIKDFYHQRKRWASKGLFYTDRFLVIKLIFIYLFYLALVTQPVLGFLISELFFVSFFISFLLKIISEYLVLRKGIQLLFNSFSLKPFLLTEILQVPYIILSGFMGIFGNLYWKDRKIKR